MSFAEGLAHPFTGFDHMLAMVAVGLWASQIGGRALWLLPLTFPVVMAVGAVLGMSGVALPWVEAGIAASVLVLGAAVALCAAAVARGQRSADRAFALLHGYSHGIELPAELGADVRRGLHRRDAGAAHDRHRDRPSAATRVPVRFVAQGAGGAIAAPGVMLLVT